MDYNLLQSSETTFPSSSNNSGFKNMSITTWLIIILVLAFLGLNIFVYLAQGTQTIVDIFNPLVGGIFKVAAVVTGETIDVAADGAKVVVGGTKFAVDKTANAIDTGLTAIQEITPNVSGQSNIPNPFSKLNLSSQSNILGQQNVSGQSSNVSGQTNNETGEYTSPNVANSGVKGEPIDKPQVSQGDQSTLNRALNTKQMQQSGGKDYQAYEASSSVNGSGKAGWCFVGEDRGYRTCAEVEASDTCMSGDIFPSHEICVNPNLRS
jgi:hypothetical protein